MGSFADYLENKLLDHVFKNTAYTQPTNLYVALLTAAALDSDGGAEIAGKEADYTGYARQLVNSWDAASGGATANTSEIAFPEKTGGADDTVTHFAILDGNAGSAADNPIGHGALTASKTITDGDTPKIPAGDLDITLD